MLDKPSRDEDEYFAREDVEKKRKLAFQQSEVMAEQQKEALRTLHEMPEVRLRPPHPEARGRGPRHVLQLQGPVGRRRRVSPPSRSSSGRRPRSGARS